MTNCCVENPNEEKDFIKLRLSILQQINITQRVPSFYQEQLDTIKWKIARSCNTASGKRNDSFILQVFNANDNTMVKNCIDEALTNDIKNNNVIINLSGIIDTGIGSLLTQFENQVYKKIEKTQTMEDGDDEYFVNFDKRFKDKMERYMAIKGVNDEFEHSSENNHNNNRINFSTGFLTSENLSRSFDIFLTFLSNNGQLSLDDDSNMAINRDDLPTIIFIVDNLELFSEDSERQTLLYNLFDFMDGNSGNNAFSTCFIGLTNVPVIEQTLEKRVHSRFANTFIIFNGMDNFNSFKDSFYDMITLSEDIIMNEIENEDVGFIELQKNWNLKIEQWKNDIPFGSTFEKMNINKFLELVFNTNKSFQFVQHCVLNALNPYKLNAKNWANFDTLMVKSMSEYHLNLLRNSHENLIRSLTDLEVLILIIFTKLVHNGKNNTTNEKKNPLKITPNSSTLDITMKTYYSIYAADINKPVLKKFEPNDIKATWERLNTLGLIMPRNRLKSQMDLNKSFKSSNYMRYKIQNANSMNPSVSLLTLDELRKALGPNHILYKHTSY